MTIIDEYLAEIEELQAQLAERDAECARLRADAERVGAILQHLLDKRGSRGARYMSGLYGRAELTRAIELLRAVSDPAGTAPGAIKLVADPTVPPDELHVRQDGKLVAKVVNIAEPLCECGHPASDHDADMNAGTNGECLHSWRGDESIEFCECIKFVAQSPAGTAPTTGGTE